MVSNPIRVLLVEDNPGDARLIREMLAEVKTPAFSLEWVDRLSKGLERVVQGEIDVVLLDLTMPDSSGLETFTRMHSRNTRVPIIPLTGIDDDAFAVNALRAGAQDYLVKGEVDAKLLAGAIRYAIERKKVQEALRQSEKRYRALFETTGTAMVVTNEELTIVLANAEFEKLSGYAKAELEGSMSLRSFIHDEDLDRMLHTEPSDDEATLIPQTHDFKFADRSDHVKSVFVTAAPVPETRGYVASLLDVTRRKKIEEELRRIRNLESIGILAGGIAHDFNNILTAILGNISLAKIYVGPHDRVLRRLTEAEKGAVRAQELTRQLLTFSKGGAPIKQVTLIGGLLRETALFALAGSGVGIEFLIAEDLDPVEVDEGQMGQVVNNLVLNAQQSMPDGGTVELAAENITVRADATRSGGDLQERRYVRATVRDHGVGIPEEHLSRIFDPYFTTKPKGSGLGLAIAHAIVEKHGGYISVESTLGVGSAFHVFIPAITTPSEALLAAEGQVLTGTGKILVMDDEEALRRLLGDMLSMLGYDGDFVSDGSQALELYRLARDSGAPYDAVIMDLTIPGGMGGKEAIAKLRAMDPAVKAIVSSGYAEDPVMADYRCYGFRGAVPKPFRIQELSLALQRVISENG